MDKFKNKFYLVSFVLLYLCSCADNNEEQYISYNCEKLDNYYQMYIEPIMQENCTGCHNQSYSAGDLRLDNFDYAVNGIIKGFVHDRVIMEPNDPRFMPLGGEKLPDSSINYIKEFTDMVCP
tara:strand:- start:4131 stop:4496 length:366 start_codon:yes stop_codon:yes gene_type:complete